MLTSSPTISAPSSPSAAFHAPPRPYHAARRTSSSHSATSPRFTVSSAPSSRRFELSATSAHSPAPAFSRSPQLKRRPEYVDNGTQYTPPGFPPTHRTTTTTTQTAQPAAAAAAAVTLPEHAAIAEPARPVETAVPADTQRGDASAEEAAITEPPEPNLRLDPQRVVVPAQHAQSAHRPSPRGDDTRDEDDDDRQSSAGGAPAGAASQSQPSPSKRVRTAQDVSVKVMPLRYETCDVKELGVLVSDMLMELVRLNDGFPLRDGHLTRFHSRYVECVYTVPSRRSFVS